MGGRAWDYKDMRSQQLLSRLIEKMRQVPQPIIAVVQVGVGWGGGGGGGGGRPGSAWAVSSKRPSCVCRMCSCFKGNGVSFAGPSFLRSALASWLRLRLLLCPSPALPPLPPLIPACTLLSLS